MTRQRTAKQFLAVCVVIGVLAAAGPGASFAEFTDDRPASGSLTADSSFNGNQGGNGNGGQAFDDSNGNGVQDDGETTYNNANQIATLDDSDTNLVIPAEVGTVSPNGNKDIAITANSITSETGFDAQNSNIGLTASGGGVQLSGQSVNSGTGSVTIDATGDVDLSGATVSAPNGDITIVADGSLNLAGASLSSNGDIEFRAQEISADSATISPTNGGTTVSATENGGGELKATDAEMSGGNSGITLESAGPMRLNGTTLRSQNGHATANLGTNSTTLYVDGTNVNDSDGTLVYDPDGITVVGSSKDATSP